MAKKKSTKRRSTEQICADKRKQRNSLYSKRRALLKKKANPKFEGLKIDKYSLKATGKGSKRLLAEYSSLHRKYVAVDEKITKINTYLFRCSSKFEKLKKQKRKLQYKRANIRRKLKKSSMSEKDRRAELITLRDLKNKETTLENAMGQDVERVRGKVFFKANAAEGTFTESVVAWKMKDLVKELLAAVPPSFDNIIIEGEKYDVKEDWIDVMMRLDWLLEEVMSFQDVTATPMVRIDADEDTRTLLVRGFDIPYSSGGVIR